MKLPQIFKRRSKQLAFAEEQPASPVMDEFAHWAGGKDVTRGYVDSMPLLDPLDTVLQARGGDFTLYDEVARDDQVVTCLRQRWDAVVSKETVVDPGDSSRRAKKAADHLKDVLARIQWDDVTRAMLAGEFYGYAVGEALWASDGAMYTLDAVKVRRQIRFGFSPVGELHILTMQNPLGEAIPPAKFWAFSTGAWHHDDPYGLGMAHWLYWPVFFKRNGVKFWLTFLEKFGQPTALGKYPQGTDSAKQYNLLQSLLAIQSNTAVTIPEGMAVELLEAARSGTADYVALYDRMNAAISKVILGHTGSTDATPGRLGGESNAASVREDIIKASSDLICASFTRTLATWLTRWNDEQAPIPRVWRRVESSLDLQAQAARDKTIFDMGFKPTIEYITETYAIEVTEKASAPVMPQPVPQASAQQMPADQSQQDQADNADPTAFADAQRFTPQQQAIEDLADTAMARTVQPVSEDAIRNAIAGARSPEDLEARLAVLFSGIEHAEFTRQLERALFAADILGFAHSEGK